MKKLILSIAMACFFITSAYSQQPKQPKKEIPPTEKKDASSIFVNTDSDIDELLKKALKRYREKSYKGAVELLTEVLKRKDIKDYSYPTRDENLFLGIKEICKNLLISIPNDDKAIIVDKQDLTAESYLKNYEKNKDVGFLYRILDECYLSKHLNKAVRILAENSIEENRPKRASFLINKLPDLYKQKIDEHNTMLLLIAYSATGQKEEVKKVINNIPDEYKEKEVSLFNKKMLLKDVVIMINDGQLNFAAGEDKNEKHEPVFIGKKEWANPLHILNQTMIGINKRLRGYPMFYNDMVLTNQSTEVIGYNAKTGEKEFNDLSLIEKKEPQSLSYPMSVRTGLIKDDILYTTLIRDYKDIDNFKGMTKHFKDFPKLLLKTELVAYDLANKKQKWSLLKSNEDNEDAMLFLSNTIVSSRPTIVDGILYVESITYNNMSESYIVAIDYKTGKYLWHTLVSAKHSAQVNQFIIGIGNSFSIPVLRGNLGFVRKDRYLYFSNAFSVMGALDVDSGDIIWIRRFESINKKMGSMRSKAYREMRAADAEEPGWAPNTCTILDENTVMFAPQKCTTLFFVNRTTGAVINALESKFQGTMRVLGVNKGKIYIYDRRIIEIDWKTKKSQTWGYYGPAAGQGTIIGDHLYMPLYYKVAVISLADRKVAQYAPIDPNLVGNVVLNKDKLVLMGLANVSLWNCSKENPDKDKSKYVEYVNNPDLGEEENQVHKLINDIGNPDINIRTKSAQLVVTNALKYEKHLEANLKHENPEVRTVVDYAYLFVIQSKQPPLPPAGTRTKKGGGMKGMGGMDGMKGMGK